VEKEIKMLEKIFTSKNRLKILEFLFFNKDETHIREISRELKISPSIVKREIDNLVSAGIIKKQRNKIEINKKCIILNDIKNIFIKTDFIFYPLKESLKNINADFILIFGSFVKGNYSLDSDIDLLIIGKAKQSEIFNALKPVENKLGREINPVIWAIKSLREKRKTGFVKEIFSKKIIMIKGDENELQKIIR